MKNIVVSGCSFSLSEGSGTVTVTSTPSTKVKFGGSYAYKSPLSIMVAAYTDESTIITGAGSGSISGSSVKTTVENTAALLENDSVSVTVTGINPSTKAAATKTITVKISSAGQSEVKSA